MKELQHRQFEFAVAGDGIIRGDIRFLPSDSPQPLVIIAHGFKGFKDWGFFPYLGEQLARSGLVSLAMNFSHNGVGASLVNFDELEKFSKNTLTRELEDLEHVLHAVDVGNIPLPAQANRQRIGLFGHSRGAFSVVHAAEHPSVFAVATGGGISRPPVVTPEVEEEWRRAKVYFVENTRTGQKLPMSLEVLEDVLRHRDSIEKAARNIRKPFLIVHGENDQTVPLSAAQSLSQWAPRSTLIVIPGGDHVFGVRHPFQGTGPQLEMLLRALCDHFLGN